MSGFQQHIAIGYRYMRIWPQRPELEIRFLDLRAINLTRHAIRHMPWLATVTLAMPYAFGHVDMLTHMVAAALMMLSLPVQGLMWLGHRAQKPLEPQDRQWYRQLKQKMLDQGMEAPSFVGQLTYWNLAELVRKAFDCNDAAFSS